MDIQHFRNHIVRPTLGKINLWSTAAENLLVGTALAESHLMYLKQIGGGPALGVYQIEPSTHLDVWKNYLDYRPEFARGVRQFTARKEDFNPEHTELIWNLAYATSIARIVYYRRPEPLPDANDAEALAKYHEVHYNTIKGAAGRTPNVLEHLAAFESTVK